jgi:5-methylcytosine-specific restriction endonuclease McrA
MPTNNAKRKLYLKEYQKNWMRSRRQDWINANGPCKHCGSWEKLEVDHIKRELKTMQASSMWSRRKEVRDKELENCQVLCKSCHLKKTLSEVTYPGIIHGTSNGYDHFGCRCEDCKLAKRKRSMKSKNPNKYKELYGDE